MVRWSPGDDQFAEGGYAAYQVTRLELTSDEKHVQKIGLGVVTECATTTPVRSTPNNATMYSPKDRQIQTLMDFVWNPNLQRWTWIHAAYTEIEDDESYFIGVVPKMTDQQFGRWMGGHGEPF
jgi:hypothetical protein